MEVTKPNNNIRYSLFVICSLVTGHWETFHGTSLHWLLITDHWSLVTAMGGDNETQQQQGSLPCCSMIKLDHERRTIRWKLAFPKKQKIKSIALG
ncbi:hypothetical protein [Dactylococcopsis salina]|uniref:hypothetical protein n=1 Tax=Dactylococcopsis salina TaxID=292566 RepID=UPI0012EADFFB|nr:hypothetical protein [Dactylococcopsis salina]